MKNKIVFLRHGESKWNLKNKFTGWYDVNLTNKGKKEALLAGSSLRKNNFFFDKVYTSVLKRAIHTVWKVLDQLNQPWLEVKKTWRLNERHYGDLQGLNKESVIDTYGKKKIVAWRRSYHSVPPKMIISKHKFSGYDKRYDKLKKSQVPTNESIELTLKRVLPYWNKIILPKFKKNKKILVVAHGNSLRALIKFLANINDKKFPDLNIPTGIPIIYEFDESFNPIKYYFL
ncbi:2,3-diphosphoglycerate-dependent phosphoglycerate mutase [Buchnera aphidicola]|uniref:2,3-diphosphoglycerate-dependent phosphoglycerate mutase n=1 Tax=Buchnera aphidicola TaxID=9 RepID=UPI0034644006